MINLKVNLNNNEEEGEELQDIFPENTENESNEKSSINTGINNKLNYYKMQNFENKLESLNAPCPSAAGLSTSKKKSGKTYLKIFISFIIIILVGIALILLFKYFYKKPSVSIPKYNESYWFIDGKNYFEDLFYKLMEANNSIYITDWWLSPEVFLRRPVNITPYLDMIQNDILINNNQSINNMTRLIDVLNYKANQGVKIYILIYKEFSIAMSINSEYTENAFNALNNKNIKITRFPSFTDTILWSNHEKLVIIDDIIGYVGGLDLCWGRYDNNNHSIYEAPNNQNIYEFPFIDYSNMRKKDITNIEYYYLESVPREESTRLPWHDVQARIIGESVENISKHFIQRWNYANSEEYHIFYDNNSTNKTEMYKKYFKEDIPPSNVEVLRSLSEWNAGINETEHSILNQYYNLIQNSKHYIYIENQFFISRSWNEKEIKDNDNCINYDVNNKIAYYIRKRIEKAYNNKENFKVFIFIPLLPGFEGDPEDSNTIKIILKHTYATISRNFGLSLIEQLEKIMGDEWRNYIAFFSLRNHALVNNIPKTEIIYIHSKLMIIDDKTVLIGSANINDRSMLGDRDSEFAVIINEKQEIINQKTGKEYIMDGKNNYNATNFAFQLRKALMAEHLGINQNDPILDDPLSEQLFSLFNNRARRNTKIYHYIFSCYPHDSFVNFYELKKAQEIKEKEKVEELLNKYNKFKDKIIGHIVEFPLLFLKDESLITSWFSKEKYIPEINFT